MPQALDVFRLHVKTPLNFCARSIDAARFGGATREATR